MNVEVRHNGIDITRHVFSYEREHKICTGIGTLKLVTAPALAGTFAPWDAVRIYEDGIFKCEYYVSDSTVSQPASVVEVTCQDNSKRLSDYFISDSYVIDYPSYSRDWIIEFLNQAGVSYEFTTEDRGNLLSNNTSLGLVSAYDQILSLLQISGMYMYFSGDGIAIIGSLNTDLASPSYSLNKQDIISISVVKNDNMLRNRAVVWGSTDPATGDWVFSDKSKITPWNFGSKDLRTVVISNSNIPNVATADDIAFKVLNEFAQITVEKHLEITGARDINLGDVVKVTTDIFKGKGLVTTYGSSMNSKGLVTRVILDERCPRLFAFFNFGDYVYAGTTESGIWRKHLSYDNLWGNFSTGLPSQEGVSDLFVRGGEALAVLFSGGAYYTDTSSPNWDLIEYPEQTAPGSGAGPIIISDGFMSRAVVIDKSTNHGRVLLDNYHGPSISGILVGDAPNFGDYHAMYSGRFGDGFDPSDAFGSRAWVADTLNGQVQKMYPISVFGGNDVIGVDIENDGRNDYVSVFSKDPSTFYVNISGGGLVGIDLETMQQVSFLQTDIPSRSYDLSQFRYSGFLADIPVPVNASLGNIFLTLDHSTVYNGSDTLNVVIVTGGTPPYDEDQVGVPALEYQYGYSDNDSYASGIFVPYMSENYLNMPNVSIEVSGVVGYTHMADNPGDRSFTYVASGPDGYKFTIQPFDYTDTSVYFGTKIDIPLSGFLPLPTHSESYSYIWRNPAGTYKLLDQYGILSVDETGQLGRVSISGIDYANTTRIKVDQFIYWLDKPYASGYFLNKVDLDAETYTRGLFYTISGAGAADEVNLRIFPHGDTIHSTGFVKYFPDKSLPYYYLRGPIYIYALAGLGEISPNATLVAIQPRIDPPFTWDLLGHDPIAGRLSRTYSFVTYSLKYSASDGGMHLAHFINFGAESVYLKEVFNGEPVGEFIWPGTPVQSERFDTYTFDSTPSGLYYRVAPFYNSPPALVPISGMPVGRVYSRAGSRETMDDFVVLRREDEAFRVITSSKKPIRLDISNVSPIVTVQDDLVSLATLQVTDSEVTEMSNSSFPSGLLVMDYRYSMFTNSDGYSILFTNPSGIYAVPLLTLSDYHSYTPYSGSSVGIPEMIETTNYSYPDQYVFFSTIGESNDVHFYQKNPSSGVFVEYGAAFGLPQSRITTIRVEDKV